MAKETKKQRKRKKKKKFRKLFVSTAAFITAAVVIIFCIYYVYFETDYFNIKGIRVVGNETYNKDYIIEKSQIKLGQKIFKIDRSQIKDIIDDEIYVKKARVLYELPNIILIEITERQEKYQIYYNNTYIVTDEEGVVLRTGSEKNELITIESFIDVLYNVGESIQFKDIENINHVFKAVDYIISDFDSDTIKNIAMDSKNSFLLGTEYGTNVRIKLDEDIKYQIIFAMKIINERLNNNLVVTKGLIDFTKGDSPVYIEDYNMEESNE